jgi:cytoskeletal protein CcmA (bactofilin family)
MSNDGLSNDEIINILFKNYMNFTTTSDDKLFYEETLLANNNNILSSNILSDTPPQSPTFTEITSYETVSTLLGDDFDIDSTWFDDKTDNGSFGSETTNVVLRLETIKLDYLGSNSSAFVCFDNSNNNILKNLIPSNYSSQGYSLSLQYDLNGVLKSVPWLATRTELAGSVAIGTSVDFGGALFDTKNGVVTFYDVNGEPNDVFTGENFYLTATKYVGTLGIDVTSATTTESSNIDFSGDISMQSNLEVASTVSAQYFVGDGSQLTNLSVTETWTKDETTNDISYNDGKVFVANDVSFGSNLQVMGDISVNQNIQVVGDVSAARFIGDGSLLTNLPSVWSLDENTNDISYADGKMFVSNDVSFGSRLQVVGDVSMESNLEISNNLVVGGTMQSEGDVTIGGSAVISGDLIANNAFTSNQNAVLSNNVEIGNSSQTIQDTSFNVFASSNGGNGIMYDGNITLYGNLQIMDGGNIIIESSNNTLTQLETNMQVTDSFSITNTGTTSALIVNQTNTSIQNIAEFQDSSINVFVIGSNGNTSITGNVSIDGDLSLNGNVTIGGGIETTSCVTDSVNTSTLTSSTIISSTAQFNDVSINANMDVSGAITANQFIGDGSLLTNLPITETWTKDELSNDISYVDGKVFVTNDVSFGSRLDVGGDVSTNANMDVSGNISASYFVGDGSLLTNLPITDTSTIWTKDESSNDISYVDGKVFVTNDVSFGSRLDVGGDVSTNANMDVSGTITANQFVGDGSLLTNLPITDTTTIWSMDNNTYDISYNDGKVFVANDVSFGSSLEVSGDVSAGRFIGDGSLLTNLSVTTIWSKDETTNDISYNDGKVFVANDVSFGSNLQVMGDISVNQNIQVVGDVSAARFIGDGSLLTNLPTTGTSIWSIDENTNDISYSDGKMFVSNDVSFGAHLQVVGDVSMENNLEVNNSLVVGGSASIGGSAVITENVYANQNIEVVGNVTATNFIGNGSQLTGVLTEEMWDKDENNNISYSDGSVTISGELIANNTITSNNNTVLSNNVDIGNSSQTIQDTSFNVFASSNGGSGIMYDGNITLYGNLQIMDGGNIVIESSNTTLTQLETNTQVTDSFSITNAGTTSALTVNQTNTSTQNIAEFQDSSINVFVIGNNGNTSITGDLNIEGDLSLNGNLSIGGVIETSSSVTDSVNTSTLTSDTVIANTIQFNETTVTTTDTSGDIGAMRFNTTRNLFEYFSTESVWNSVATYKGDQPPYLLSPQFTAFSQSVLIEWTKFNSVYIDSFDGKAYPLSLQTFIDISFTDINSTSTSGWNTLYIGKGSYDTNGNATTHLESFTITSSSDTAYTNNTDYTIAFSDKPSTVTLPSFTQNDTFDLRIYSVNQSQTTPNYIYLYNVALKTSGPPGSVTVLSTDSFLQNQFTIDLSYNLDRLDSTVTTGLDIAQYDVSFTRIDSKSLSPVTHSGNLLIDWDGSTSLSKSDIDVTDLHPGAQYEINVRAQNTASLDSSTTTGYAYGDYGDVFSSTDFTNIGTYQYITSSDLNSVSSTGMAFSLVGNSTINCNVSGTSSRTNRIIMNSNSSIDVTGTSEFYVNYGLQGTDMTDSTNLTLVNTVITKYVDGASNSSITIPYISVSDPTSVTSQSDSVAGYTFASASSYTDEGDSNDYNKGFVYSSTIERTDSNTNNTIFNSNFVASANSYELEYVISSTTDNQSARINNSGNTSVSDTTSEFYIDDYSSTPTITMSSSPTISVTSSTTLFGIPSVLTVQLTASLQISNFASYIIPHNSSNYHTVINAISDKNSYSFALLGQTNISSTDAYTITYSKTSSVGSSSYDANTESSFVANVSYLNHSSSPTINTQTNTTSIGDIGKVFRDSSTTYSGLTLYTFNGSNAIGSSISSSSSINNSTLLYFNGRFVSGGYSATYDGTTISPFSNWSSGYAASGQNYISFASTGTGGFKWIAFDVSTKQSDGVLDLSTFKINGSTPTLSNFGSTYEAYIYQHGNIGALNSVNNTGATSWFNEGNTTISSAKNGNGASNDGINGFVNLSLSGNIYLIVGLPISSTGYFTFS